MGSENPRQDPAGRRCQAALGLSGRCGSVHFYDALYKQDFIQHVLVRHEQAAVHAADGLPVPRVKSRVALVTSGPGLTNAVTGIGHRLHRFPFPWS